MELKHVFIECIVCGAEIEVLDDDREWGEVECPNCGYVNELDELGFDEREF